MFFSDFVKPDIALAHVRVKAHHKVFSIATNTVSERILS